MLADLLELFVPFVLIYLVLLYYTPRLFISRIVAKLLKTNPAWNGLHRHDRPTHASRDVSTE